MKVAVSISQGRDGVIRASLAQPGRPDVPVLHGKGRSRAMVALRLRQEFTALLDAWVSKRSLKRKD